MEFLETQFAHAKSGGPVDGFWFAPDQFCVTEAGAARQVLGNREAEYEDTSDFFFTRDGVAGPRAAQLAVARASRTLLDTYLAARHGELPALVDRVLTRPGSPHTSQWPDAGNRLLDAYLRDLLLYPGAAPATHAVLDQIIDHAVLAGARQRRSGLSRSLLRRRIGRTLAAEADRRARDPAPAEAPRDLFDVVLAGGLDGPRSQVTEVYLSFLFALVGALGFALGWAVYLVGTHPDTQDAPPAWVVREALRLWPVAWLFERRPSRPHLVAGTPVGPADRISVCTYLVHRDPRYWDRPEEFEPRRWAEARRSPAFLPFGFGPHTCTGATAATGLLEELIGLVTGGRALTVTPLTTRAHVGPALAPPRFALTLTSAPAPEQGEEVNP